MQKNFRIIIPGFTIIFASLTIFAAEFPEIVFSAAVNKVSGKSYTLDYSVSISGIDPSVYMDQNIFYPEEYLIAESYITSGTITEKDFLNSEKNYDLNSDGDTNDTFSITSKGGIFTLAGQKISPLFKKRNTAMLLLPFNEKNSDNLIRIKPESQAFTVHSIDTDSGRIIAGAGKDTSGVSFKKYPNSIIIIEIIPDSADAGKSGIVINNETAAEGITNESNLSSNGSPLSRYTGIVPVQINGSSTRGNIKIDGIDRSFTARIRYCFAISTRVVIFSEKIVRSVNRQK